MSWIANYLAHGGTERDLLFALAEHCELSADREAALGGEVIERGGSRVGLIVNGVRGNFHHPHPSPDTNKGAVDAVRLFLTNAKVKP